MKTWGGSWWAAWVASVVFVSAVFVSVAAAQASDDHRRHKAETNGLALTAGLGAQYGGLGAQAAYYLQVPDSLFRLSPYAGMGLVACAGSTGNETSCMAGYALGVLGSWGHKHRATLSLSYSTLGGAVLYTRDGPSLLKAHGVGLAIGYEWMSFNGFVFRADIGMAYASWPSRLHRQTQLVLTTTLFGVGYKF